MTDIRQPISSEASGIRSNAENSFPRRLPSARLAEAHIEVDASGALERQRSDSRRIDPEPCQPPADNDDRPRDVHRNTVMQFAVNVFRRLAVFIAVAASSFALWLIVQGLKLLGAPASLIIGLTFAAHLIFAADVLWLVAELIVELKASIRKIIDSAWNLPMIILVSLIMIGVAASIVERKADSKPCRVCSSTWHYLTPPP